MNPSPSQDKHASRKDNPVNHYELTIDGQVKPFKNAADVARDLIAYYGLPFDRFMSLVEQIEENDHLVHEDIAIEIRAIRFPSIKCQAGAHDYQAGL